jgi:hypothetical protein
MNGFEVAAIGRENLYSVSAACADRSSSGYMALVDSNLFLKPFRSDVKKNVCVVERVGSCQWRAVWHEGGFFRGVLDGYGAVRLSRPAVGRDAGSRRVARGVNRGDGRR